ncbi:AraC family transcriptional regulator [Paenibacillus sp. IB182496]|uniref:AraC family transcriptional regulator n=1 Tax=Paenibacillus sabuli TaxID=2772509 RepID=A0A927BWV8_9BACL|nr:AraC family transcriptional regulator [Paenibacillus sabuli]MBD2847822.1 AraC family transcriptional regulator [Paenibacillus sabuli]
MWNQAPAVFALTEARSLTVAPKQSVRLLLEHHTILIVSAGFGSAQLVRRSTPVQLQYARMLVGSAGDAWELRSDPSEQLRAHLITYDAFQEQVPAPAGRRRLIQLPVQASRLPSWFAEIGEKEVSLARQLVMAAAAPARSRLDANVSTGRMLYELLDGIRDRFSSSAAPSDDKHAAIEGAVAYIERHYASKLTRAQVARIFGLSLKAFTSGLKEATGRSFVQFVNDIRVRRAKEQLLSTRRKLSEIAHRVGYKDEFYLSRKFKQTVGVAPSVYLKRPKTIASMDHAYTLDLLSLGISPAVALADPWLKCQYPHLLAVEGCHAIDWGWHRQERYNLLEAKSPDVIIHAELGGEDLDAFRKIAPVLQIPWKGIGWRDHFRMVADIVDQTREAERWLQHFGEKLEQAKEQLHRLLGPPATIAMFNIRESRMALYGSGYMGADLLYHSLALRPPDSMRGTGAEDCEWREMEMEELELLDADYMIVAVENSAGGRLRAQTVMRQAVWNNLRAVRNGHMFVVDMTKWYGYGPAAIELQLAELLDLLGKRDQKSK